MTTTRTHPDPHAAHDQSLELLDCRDGSYEVTIGRGGFTGAYGTVILRGTLDEVRASLAPLFEQMRALDPVQCRKGHVHTFADVEAAGICPTCELDHERWADEVYG